jgi:hypothetical protein
VSSRAITDELVRQVTDDLRQRYALDDEDVRELGHRLAASERSVRSSENQAFAERFVAAHRETFDRLGK